MGNVGKTQPDRHADLPPGSEYESAGRGWRGVTVGRGSPELRLRAAYYSVRRRPRRRTAGLE